MSIRVIVNGAAGRMGQEAVKAISADPDLELVGKAYLGDTLAELIQTTKADVVVDFTTANAGLANTLSILDSGACPVVGTSGFSASDLKRVKQRCDSLQRGAIIAPNFSIGAVLMIQCAQTIAHYLPDVEIIELHHDQKVDSPSQTALQTADAIDQARESKPIKPSNAVVPGARGANVHEIAIHSVRLPGLVAHQQVIFGGHGETLCIQHDSIDRACFMPGVLLACKKVIGLNTLVYGLAGLLTT